MYYFIINLVNKKEKELVVEKGKEMSWYNVWI